MSTCMCGCGESVARRFVPGHSGRLMHRLYCMARDTPRERVEVYGQRWLPLNYAREVSDAFGIHFERLLFGDDWDREY